MEKNEKIIFIIVMVAALFVVLFILFMSIDMLIDNQCYQLEPGINYQHTICERYGDWPR